MDKHIPCHIGIIMDGNGRWATARGKKRSYGHKAGCQNVDRVVSHAFKSGVDTVTLFAFSCENWDRPKEEVDELMKLIKVYFTKNIQKVLKNGVKLNVIGDRTKLTAELQDIINTCENDSKDNGKKTLNIAINYGGRQEIVMAVNKVINSGEEVNIQNISKNLYTYSCGEPDLIIRTGGEYRISNFMLFQSAYSELYFSDALWPDFDEQDLDKALDSYKNRKRRFGKV